MALDNPFPHATHPAPASVSHPPHYTAHPSGIECITITRHFNFNLGNAIKYIWRSDQKGAQVEDLQKAIWYLQDEVKRIQGDQSCPETEWTQHLNKSNS